MNIRIGLFAALALVVPFSFVSAAAKAPDADSRPVVFYAVFKGIDPFLDFVETTVANDPKASAFLRVERQEWNAMLAADGPDLTRPIGLVVRLDGQTLVPTYFFPVKEKTNEKA